MFHYLNISSLSIPISEHSNIQMSQISIISIFEIKENLMSTVGLSCHLITSNDKVNCCHLLSSYVIRYLLLSSDVICCHMMSSVVIWCHLLSSDVICGHLLSSNVSVVILCHYCKILPICKSLMQVLEGSSPLRNM